jgi:hypothetical protein
MWQWEYASLYLVSVRHQIRESRLFRDDKVTVENRLVAVIVRPQVEAIHAPVSSDIAAFNWAGQQGWRVSLDNRPQPESVPDFLATVVHADGEAVACFQFYLERPITA